MKPKSVILTTFACAITFSSNATAAIVSIDVNGSYTGASVLDSISHVWTSLSNGNTFSMDSQTVTFNRSGWSAGSIGSPSIGLFNSYLHNNAGGAQTFSLSGLDMTKTYNIVIYSAQSGGWNRGGTFDLVAGTYVGPDPKSTTGDQQATFAEGINYVRFDNITAAAGGIISFSGTNGPEGINIFNGFEIQSVQAVPEPSAAMLGGLGLLLLVRRRR